MASGAIEAQFSDFVGTSNAFLFVSCISYGILCAQAYEYFLAFRNDPWVLKASTGAVMFLETLHFALTLHTLYHFTAVAADNPQTVLDIPWDAGVITLVDTLVVLIVQIYYIWRIWILSKRSRALVIVMDAIVGVRCTLELVVVAYLFLSGTDNFVVFRSNRVTFIVYICWLSFGALGDVLVAVSVGTYLVRRRTGFRSTDTIIRKAVAFSVNSGAITAAVAVASLVTFLGLGSRNIVNNGLLIFATGLYANSFFGMLNARQIFRRNLEADNCRVFDPSIIVFRDHVGTRTSELKSSERSRPEF